MQKTSFFLRSFALFTLVLALNACDRPIEPGNNYIEIRPVEMNAKLWSNIPKIFHFNLSLKVPHNNWKISSPNFELATTESVEESQLPSWKIPFEKLQSVFLTASSDLFLSLESTNLAASEFIFFNGEIASERLDLLALPFSKAIRFTIQDNPTATRSFKDATGAKIVMKIQRRLLVRPAADEPLAGTYRACAEQWWVHDDTEYVKYQAHIESLVTVLKIAFAQDIQKQPDFLNTLDLTKVLSEKRLKEFQKKIEAHAAQKLRQKLKQKILVALSAKGEDYDPSKLDLFWDYFGSDSALRFATSLAARTLKDKALDLNEKLRNTKSGNLISNWVAKEAEGDNAELEKMQMSAIELLLQTDN